MNSYVDASAKPATGYTLEFFVRALERVVAARGLTSFALVGHSLGGLVAAEFARRRRGGELRLLGLIDPAGFLRTPRLALRIAEAMRQGYTARLFLFTDGVVGRIVWANAVSVKIRWDDGEQVT